MINVYKILCFNTIAGFDFGISASGKKYWLMTNCPHIEDDWFTCVPLILLNFGPHYWKKHTQSKCRILNVSTVEHV